jgi:nucleoside-diphosphate-sugar epimerase
MRELAETAYMFTRPFVLDSRESEERLGVSPTTMETGMKDTVAWWRDQDGSTR